MARRRPARESSALRETTNLTVLLVAAGAAAVGLSLLYVAGRSDWWLLPDRQVEHGGDTLIEDGWW